MGPGFGTLFFPLGGLHICCDLETISRSSTGAFVGEGLWELCSSD